jgi:hypothetical protein
MFKLIRVYAAEKLNGALPSCDHCGHDIRNVFVIEDESGRIMKVGSDCVMMLIGRTETAADVNRYQKRLERAARQWRDAKKRRDFPQPLAGETREQYINRRVSEMTNALKAGKAWTAYYNAKFQPKGHIGLGWSVTWDMRVEKRAKRLGIKIERHTVIQRHVQRHAKKWQANPFDFKRPIWDLVKI